MVNQGPAMYNKQIPVEHITTRLHETTITSATVAGEARKGYDVPVVGIGRIRNSKGGFGKDRSLITDGFKGRVAAVDSHSSRVDQLSRCDRILIPVPGTDVSRRAAEIALTLARARLVGQSDIVVTAIVAGPLRRDEAEDGDRQNALPADGAAGFHCDAEDFRIEKPRW